MEIPPLTNARPTNADIVNQVNAVHECLEDHRDSTKRHFTKLDSGQLKANRRLDVLDDKVDNITVLVDGLVDSLGTRPSDPKQTVATMTPHKAVFTIAATTGGTIAGLFMLLKVGVVLAPFAWLAVQALWHFAAG